MPLNDKKKLLKKIINMQKPKCPYCNKKMKIWEVPPINVGDGLGWGTPFLFICFNNNCKTYKSGWNNIQENYSHNASYRCINFPETKNFELIPIFSPTGASGQILNEKELSEKENLKKNYNMLHFLVVFVRFYVRLKSFYPSLLPPSNSNLYPPLNIGLPILQGKASPLRLTYQKVGD